MRGDKARKQVHGEPERQPAVPEGCCLGCGLPEDAAAREEQRRLVVGSGKQVTCWMCPTCGAVSW